MNYEQGLTVAVSISDDPTYQAALAELAKALRSNLADDRRYGSTETTRAGRAKIVDQLNALVLANGGRSFNDLVLGRGV